MEVYLNFKNQSADVLNFYSEVFDTSPKNITHFDDIPSDPDHPLPESVKPLVMNSTIEINGTNVMISDSPEGMGPDLSVGNNISLVIETQSEEEIQSLYAKLSEDGLIGMPLAPTFWAKQYASVTDKFGIGWQLNLS